MWGLNTPHLTCGMGVTAVCEHGILVLIVWPLVLGRRRAVLGPGGREGEVLPGVGLRGDGVGLGPRWRGLFL